MVTEFKKIKKKGNIFFLSLFLILSIGIIGFLVFSNWKINQRRTELQKKIEILKKEIQILEKKNQQLEVGISEIKTKDYLEKVAREQLNLQYPGEKVVVIAKKEEEEEKEEEEIKKEKNFWQKFLEKIGF